MPFCGAHLGPGHPNTALTLRGSHQGADGAPGSLLGFLAPTWAAHSPCPCPWPCPAHQPGLYSRPKQPQLCAGSFSQTSPLVSPKTNSLGASTSALALPGLVSWLCTLLLQHLGAWCSCLWGWGPCVRGTARGCDSAYCICHRVPSKHGPGTCPSLCEVQQNLPSFSAREQRYEHFFTSLFF